jgi:chitin synthase
MSKLPLVDNSDEFFIMEEESSLDLSDEIFLEDCIDTGPNAHSTPNQLEPKPNIYDASGTLSKKAGLEPILEVPSTLERTSQNNGAYKKFTNRKAAYNDTTIENSELLRPSISLLEPIKSTSKYSLASNSHIATNIPYEDDSILGSGRKEDHPEMVHTKGLLSESDLPPRSTSLSKSSKNMRPPPETFQAKSVNRLDQSLAKVMDAFDPPGYSENPDYYNDDDDEARLKNMADELESPIEIDSESLIEQLFYHLEAHDLGGLERVYCRKTMDLNLYTDGQGFTLLQRCCMDPALPISILNWVLGLSRVNVNSQDAAGETAIYKACLRGSLDQVDRLLYHKADPSIATKLLQTPLMAASSGGHSEVCRRVLISYQTRSPAPQVTTGASMQAYLDFKDHTGKTALLLASFQGHSETVKLLLDFRASINLTDIHGWTSLMMASFSGHSEVVDLLLQARADPSATAKRGQTALSLAKQNGHAEVVQILQMGNKPLKKGHHRQQLSRGQPFPDLNSLQIPTPAYHPTELYSKPKNRPSMPNDVGGSDPYPCPLPDSWEEEDTMESFQDISLDEPLIEKTEDLSDLKVPSYTSSLNRQGTLRARRNRRGSINSAMDPFKGNAAAQQEQPVPFSNLSKPTDFEPKWYHFGLNPQSRWELFSQVVTFCCFSWALKKFGNLTSPGNQQAWREKVALCVIIAMISAMLGFLTFGFASLICKKKIPIFVDWVAKDYGSRSSGKKLMIVRGQLFDVGLYFPLGGHRPILPLQDEDLDDVIQPLYGHDISSFFPPDSSGSTCEFWPEDHKKNPCKNLEKMGNSTKLHCHISTESWSALKSLSTNDYVAYSWQNITSPWDQTSKYFVYNDKVYGLSEYFRDENEDRYFREWDPILQSFIGRDATKDILRNSALKKLVPCFDEQLIVGKLDGTTTGCFIANLVMICSTVVILAMTLIKFLAAVAFDWFLSWKIGKISSKKRDKDTLSHVLLLVTCYSEGLESVKGTLDSLALSDYDDMHKLLFVIADGDITGSGNEKSTPQILLDLMEPFDLKAPAPKPKSYVAIGDGLKQHNMAQVHIGFYNILDHRVPYMLIIKCGLPYERVQPKAGNRGKRDSQLILMHWLTSICFNEPMTPLHYDMFEKVRQLAGVTPDRYELVLMVDADTRVMPDALGIMISAMERDPLVMGLCGETQIANKRDTWVTRIQVYEYYISHHLGKAFESIFGGVTCLPGCFCMYRVKAPNKDGYNVPVLANPDIVTNYSSNDVSTLHKKNLLLLGEDRYLTTLMMRAFPNRKMIYVPRAVCKTVVPDEFNVLLSQRRRWINSTIHNLMELVLVPELCGIFCCSMQFVILLELIGTVVLPASMCFTIYLIIAACMGQDVLLPLAMMAGVYLLQAILILSTTKKVSYVMWMGVFVLALPIWNLVLPAYAFWRFDDFSWGATRKIDGPDTGHGEGGHGNNDSQNQGPESIPFRKWEAWHELTVAKREKRQAQKEAQKAKIIQEQNRILQTKMEEDLNIQKNIMSDLEKMQSKTPPSTGSEETLNEHTLDMQLSKDLENFQYPVIDEFDKFNQVQWDNLHEKLAAEEVDKYGVVDENQPLAHLPDTFKPLTTGRPLPQVGKKKKNNTVQEISQNQHMKNPFNTVFKDPGTLIGDITIHDDGSTFDKSLGKGRTLPVPPSKRRNDHEWK